LFEHKAAAAALLSCASLAGCLQTAPTGPGDTQFADNGDAGGGPQQVEAIGISGAGTSAGGTPAGTQDQGPEQADQGQQQADASVAQGPNTTPTVTSGDAATTQTAQNAGTGNAGAGTNFVNGSGAPFVGPQFVGQGLNGSFATAPNINTPQVGLNTAPVASFSIAPACLPAQNTAVTLQSTSIDADGDPLVCDWSAPAIHMTSDNGCTVSGDTFINADAIPIDLTVRDPGGAFSTAHATLFRCQVPVP
jgi:hypothetical protein